MQIQYAVSLWNYYHYSELPEIGEIADVLQQNDLGLELWNEPYGKWDLLNGDVRQEVKALLANLPISYHTDIGQSSKDFHLAQIEVASELGAEVLVLHSDNLYLPGTKDLDIGLASYVVEQAEAHGIIPALENGQLPFLVKAIDRVPGLMICLDVGHVYLVDEPMSAFLDQLGERIAHLHLQETLSPVEMDLLGQSGIILDHYIPGTGGIPAEDWALLSGFLTESDYTGMAVFEIQPRKPLQTAVLGRNFFERMVGAGEA